VLALMIVWHHLGEHEDRPQNLVNLLAHFVLVDISISSPVGILKSMMGRRMNAFQPPNEIADDEEDKAAF